MTKHLARLKEQLHLLELILSHNFMLLYMGFILLNKAFIP